MESTWHEIEAWGKAHPVALGLIVFAVGFVFIYYLWGGSSTPAPAQQTGPSDAYYQAAGQIAASGNALQAAQLQSQDNANALSAELAAKQADDATQLSIAQTQAQATTQVAQYQQESTDTQTAAAVTLGGYQLQATQGQTAASVTLGLGQQQTQVALGAQQQQSTDLASTLSAWLGGKQSDNQLQAVISNNGAATQQAQIAANASVQNTATAAQAQEASYVAQTQQAGYAAQTAQAQSHDQATASEYISGSHDYTAGILAAINAGAPASSQTANLGVLYGNNVALLQGY